MNNQGKRAFGKYLKTARTEAGQTQLSASTSLNVSEHYISQFENGHCFPALKHLPVFVELYNLEKNELIEFFSECKSVDLVNSLKMKFQNIEVIA